MSLCFMHYITILFSIFELCSNFSKGHVKIYHTQTYDLTLIRLVKQNFDPFDNFSQKGISNFYIFHMHECMHVPTIYSIWVCKLWDLTSFLPFPHHLPFPSSARYYSMLPPSHISGTVDLRLSLPLDIESSLQAPTSSLSTWWGVLAPPMIFSFSFVLIFWFHLFPCHI
jgi:hypothetical protein